MRPGGTEGYGGVGVVRGAVRSVGNGNVAPGVLDRRFAHLQDGLLPFTVIPYRDRLKGGP